jgi:hypothetical protein
MFLHSSTSHLFDDADNSWDYGFPKFDNPDIYTSPFQIHLACAVCVPTEITTVGSGLVETNQHANKMNEM